MGLAAWFLALAAITFGVGVNEPAGSVFQGVFYGVTVWNAGLSLGFFVQHIVRGTK
jgi:hypothetical protein